MAQPTTSIKQNSVRRNEPRAKKVETAPAASPAWSLSFDKVRADLRTNLTLGVLLMLLAIGLLVAFISYLFNGPADQSLVGAPGTASLREAGEETRNFLGVAGAYVAQVFVFRWFGVGALGLPLIVFLAGFKLALGRELLPLARTTKGLLFGAVWTSLLLGYIVMATGTVETGSVWCGGIGYELNMVLKSLLGWGSIAVIGFLLFLFLVYFYNITALQFPAFVARLGAPSGSKSPRPVYDDIEDDYNVDRPGVVAPGMITAEDEDEADDEQVPDDLPADVYPAEDPVVAPRTPSFKVNGLRPEVPDDEQEVAPTVALTIKDPSLIADLPSVIQPTFDVELPDADADLVALHGLYDPTLDLPNYKLPTVELMTDYPVNNKAQVSMDELEANKTKIEDTLRHFNIGIKDISATIGPTVTLYEIIPADGVRISKIKSLEDDIALSLAALGIRIIAPMPGQGTIGIEVPNKSREMVSMRSVITSDKFAKSTADLPVVLGKTISNEILVVDLAKMPHLLMAGATGQGKSVGLNVLLTSLIYKKHPAQLKLVLVDPKKVELTLFNKIERHFLAKLPDADEAIITDTKKVVNTLNSLCIEMDNRYNLLKDAGCRNLKEYNVKFTNRRLSPEKGHKFMPYIVLVIDELADLMMTAGKEVEQPIARLAQLARAIGIHLVVATQRPSVNVITGLIKANFPARLSFKVTSKIDSRTILDAGGAEQLVGMGDMLLSLNSDIVRLQCPFVDTNEIEEICEFVGNQRGYDDAYALPEFAGDDGGQGEEKDVDLENRDPMFDEAARLVVVHQQGSTSLIQRRLKLGYNRAGRLIDQLEAAGIVGAFEGSKARDVLIQDSPMLEELLKKLG